MSKLNKFKKSTLITITALILCFTTLVMTAFAATQNLSSYETLKQALLKMPSIENATIGGSIKLLDNGAEIISADITAKMENYQTMSSKSSVNINGKTTTNEQWSNSEKTVWKSSDSDKYNVNKNISAYMNSANSSYNTYVYKSDYDDEVSYSYEIVGIGGGNQNFDNLSPSEQKLINAAIDMVAGDVKNYFTTNGNTITLNLEKNQIPQIVQLLVSVLAENSSSTDYDDEEIFIGNAALSMKSEESEDMPEDEFETFLNNFPGFTDDTAIQSVNMDITLDDNGNISEVKGIVAVTGTDTNGVYHTFTLEMDFTISDIGTTTADTIDLTGKETEEHDIFNIDMPGITESYIED